MTRSPKLAQILQVRFIRYLLAAGTATLVDILVYTLLFALIVDDGVEVSKCWGFQTAFGKSADICFSGKDLAFIGGFAAGLLANFWLSKALVFQESVLKTRTQFTRFALVAFIVFAANWHLMRFFWSFLPPLLPFESVNLTAFFIRGLAASIVAVLSFVFHKVFSFRV